MTIKFPTNIPQEYLDGIKDGVKIANNVLKRSGIGYKVEIPKLIRIKREPGKAGSDTAIKKSDGKISLSEIRLTPAPKRLNKDDKGDDEQC